MILRKSRRAVELSSCRGMAVSERWVRPLNYAFTSLAGEGEVGVEMTGCSIQIVFCVYE